MEIKLPLHSNDNVDYKYPIGFISTRQYAKSKTEYLTVTGIHMEGEVIVTFDDNTGFYRFNIHMKQNGIEYLTEQIIAPVALADNVLASLRKDYRFTAWHIYDSKKHDTQ